MTACSPGGGGHGLRGPSGLALGRQSAKQRAQVPGRRHRQALDFCHSSCSHHPWTHTHTHACASARAVKHAHALTCTHTLDCWPAARPTSSTAREVQRVLCSARPSTPPGRLPRGGPRAGPVTGRLVCLWVSTHRPLGRPQGAGKRTLELGVSEP